MKLSNLFLFLALSMIIFSCSKEDEIPSYEESSLYGSWRITSLDYSGKSTTSFLGIESTSTFTGTGVDMDMIVQFMEDPQNLVSAGGYTIELITETLGQTSSSSLHFTDFMMPGTWKVEKNKLIIEAQDILAQEAVIKKLNDTVMALEGNYEETASEMGVTITTYVKVIYSLEKVL